MCRRRNQPTPYSTSPFPSPSQYQYQYQCGGCCGAKRARRQARRELEAQALAAQLASTHISPSGNQAHQSNSLSNLSGNQQQVIFVPVPTRKGGCRRSNRPRPQGPITGMAALLLGGISLGAQKIQERRDKKKEAKRALLWEEEQASEQARKEGNVKVIDERVRDGGRRRKSSEAREDRARGEAQGSRSSSVEREMERERQAVEGGEAPPSYEAAVGQTKRG